MVACTTAVGGSARKGDKNVLVVLDDAHSGLPGRLDVCVRGQQDDVALLVL